MLALAGQDLTNYFPIPLSSACPDLVDNQNLELLYKTFSPVVSSAVHTSGKLQPASNTALNNANWYSRQLVPALRRYHKGPLVYKRGNFSKTGSEDDENRKRDWAMINGRIYDLSDYLYTVKRNPEATLYQYLASEVVTLFEGRAGQDISDQIEELDTISAEDKQRTLDCINTLFFVGYPDPRELPRCELQPYMLLAFAALIVTVILIKVRLLASFLSFSCSVTVSCSSSIRHETRSRASGQVCHSASAVL